MGYSLIDSFSYMASSDDVFGSTNSIPQEQEPVLTTADRLRRYDTANVDTCRASVYVPCNIPRWCPIPRTFVNQRHDAQPHYQADRYIDLSVRENQVLDCVMHSSSPPVKIQSPNFIATSPNVTASSPCHYVDLDISNNSYPGGHERRNYFQPEVDAHLSRNAVCEYAELDFDASRNGIPKQIPKIRTETSPKHWPRYGSPESLPQSSIDYGFPSRPPESCLGYESVGCQADLDEGYVQDSSDFDENETLNSNWTYTSPYSEIPVYRRAYDQFRSPASSPYRVIPEIDGEEQLRPYQDLKEAHSPRRQKGKKHRVSFKVRIQSWPSICNCSELFCHLVSL